MWPQGARCAVAYTFDFDAESVWTAGNPQNVARPGLLSQGRYGPRVAIPLILDLLNTHGIRATFFVPGSVAEEYPEAVAEIAQAGHELAVHGYLHIPPTLLDPDSEEQSLLLTRRILRGYAGEVTGYRAPEWEVGPHTLGLLDRHGFNYSSNMMDDIRPYLHPGTQVIELPVHWTLDDAAHFAFDADDWGRKISTPSEVREIWEAEFEGIYELGGVFILTLHPHIIGRPHRLKLLEHFISFVAAHSQAWIAPCHEIALHARTALSP